MDEQNTANICTDNCTNTEIEETREEKKRRLGRERTRKHREKNRVEEPPESFTDIAASWPKNNERLLKEDPTLYAQLSARHQEVEELEVEAEEIEKGVQKGLRAETVSALTPHPQNVMPMPDDSYRDIKAHVLMNGLANYRQIEAASIKGEPLDEISDYYRRYGFQLRIQSDTLQTAREMLVLYALRTHDQNLDWQVVREAIADCSSYKGFSPNADELKKLIQEHRG
jgi:hypothetical protein